MANSTNRRSAAPSYIFVYGTLRSAPSHQMSKVLERYADRVGRGRLPGILYDVGRYPGAVRKSGTRAFVWGDVYNLRDPERALKVLKRHCRRVLERAVFRIELSQFAEISREFQFLLVDYARGKWHGSIAGFWPHSKIVTVELFTQPGYAGQQALIFVPITGDSFIAEQIAEAARLRALNPRKDRFNPCTGGITVQVQRD